MRASGVLFGWLMVRTAAQAALFILVARSLGAEGYGALIAAMAVTSFFAPLAGLGGQSLLVREGARNPAGIPEYVGDALRLWVWSAPPLILVALAVCYLILPASLPIYSTAAIVLADLACASFVELLARVWQAQHKMAGFGAVMTGLIVARLVAYYWLLGFPAPTPALWASLYFISSAVYTALAAAVALHAFGRPRRSGRSLGALSRAGFPFAFARSAMRVQSEANKPILARLDTIAGAGVFSAAQRVTDLVSLPLIAMLETMLPRAHLAADPLRAMLRLGRAPLLFALIGGALLAAAAPSLPALLGPSFANSTDMVRLLAFLPALLVIRSLLTLALAARNRQQYFLPAFGVSALMSVFTTMACIQQFGRSGAGVAAYATEITLIAILGGLLVYRR